MSSRTTTMAVSLIAVTALWVAALASAAPLSKVSHFETSSLNVSCGIEIAHPGRPRGEVLCAARGIPAPKGSSKAEGDSGFVQLGLLGRPRLLRLSQDSFAADTVVKLGRGRLWNQLGVTCHLAQVTVMCFNGDNHGFVIGNGRYRSF